MLAELTLTRAQYDALPVLHISRWQYDDLPEYSVTLPSGVYIGKQWRAHTQENTWVVRGYVEVEDKMRAGIRTWRPHFTRMHSAEVTASLARYKREVDAQFIAGRAHGE